MLDQNYTFVLKKDKCVERSLKRHVLKTLFITTWLERKRQNRTRTKKNNQKKENQKVRIIKQVISLLFA